LSVCSPTPYPPHTNITSEFPIIGIILKKFVITAAPQKDICPQGNTYPKKETAIIITHNIKPGDHPG
jgi:hypothetical protein